MPRCATKLLALLIATMPALTSVDAAEPLVLISAFAKGEDGAIIAYRLNQKTGSLSELHRNTDVEHPFFLAVAGNGRFLYSIHAAQFGGKAHEQVAAYRIDSGGRLTLLNRQSAKVRRPTIPSYLMSDRNQLTVTLQPR